MNKGCRFYSEEVLQELLDSLDEIDEKYLKSYSDGKAEYKQIRGQVLRDIIGIPQHTPFDKYCGKLKDMSEDLGYKLDKSVFFHSKRADWFWVSTRHRFLGYSEDLKKESKERMRIQKEQDAITKVDGTYGLNNERHRDGVYLIESSGFYKIGRSKDIKKRMASLQTASPTEMKLVCTYYPVNISIDRMERCLHKEFADYRGMGEWFKMDFTVEEFKDACVRINNNKGLA